MLMRAFPIVGAHLVYAGQVYEQIFSKKFQMRFLLRDHRNAQGAYSKETR